MGRQGQVVSAKGRTSRAGKQMWARQGERSRHQGDGDLEAAPRCPSRPSQPQPQPTCIITPARCAMEAAPPTCAGETGMEGCGDRKGCTAIEAASTMAGLSATRWEESSAEAAGCAWPELAPAAGDGGGGQARAGLASAWLGWSRQPLWTAQQARLPQTQCFPPGHPPELEELLAAESGREPPRPELLIDWRSWWVSARMGVAEAKVAPAVAAAATTAALLIVLPPALQPVEAVSDWRSGLGPPAVLRLRAGPGSEPAECSCESPRDSWLAPAARPRNACWLLRSASASWEERSPRRPPPELTVPALGAALGAPLGAALWVGGVGAPPVPRLLMLPYFSRRLRVSLPPASSWAVAYWLSRSPRPPVARREGGMGASGSSLRWSYHTAAAQGLHLGCSAGPPDRQSHRRMLTGAGGAVGGGAKVAEGAGAAAVDDKRGHRRAHHHDGHNRAHDGAHIRAAAATGCLCIGVQSEWRVI